MEQEVFSIDDLCSKVTDGSHFSPENVTNGVYPMYSVKDMDYNGFKNSDYKTIDQSTYEKLCKSDCRPLKNDVLIAKDGSYLKHVFRVKEDMNACILSSIAILRPNIEKINPDYFVYLLRSSSIKNSMANYVSGAALPRIILKAFKKMKIELIKDRLYQDKIASILSTYDDLIEKNNRKIEILQDMAEELYKEWFVRFRFPGYKTAKFTDGIPDGWEYERLGNLANISTGKCNREDAEEDGIYPLFDRSQEIKKSSSWLKDCEAIIVPGEGTSFIPRYYKGKFNLHQRCYCVEPKQDNIGFFLFQTLMMHRIYFLYVATGATVPSLRQNNFTNFKVLMPNEDLYERYNSYSASWHKEITMLEQQNNNLKQQRDLLLPRLMSGKLEVKVKQEV